MQLRVRKFAVDAVVSPATAGGAGAGGSARTRRVGYWVMTTTGMVFVMVVLGGVTRLTRSGLSIVEWRPEGEKLPRTDEEWAVEFEKYKAFPEFQRVNRHMSLDEFKPIYFMEWFHRFWGRAIGVAFGLPMLYYTATKAIPRPLWGRFGLLLGLGAAQGGVGWWMVKSGLEHERFGEHAIPRVSPYRLATHVSGSSGSSSSSRARTHPRIIARAHSTAGPAALPSLPCLLALAGSPPPPPRPPACSWVSRSASTARSCGRGSTSCGLPRPAGAWRASPRCRQQRRRLPWPT